MARPLTLAAAIAAALLFVSGAGGSPAQTPKRGGTLVFATPAFEPACLNVVVPRCGSGAAINSLLAVSQKVLAQPYDVGPDFSWRPRLVSRVDFTRKRPFTLTYHIRAEARWSDGVPVSARDFLFTLRMIRAHGREEDRRFHRVIRTIRAVDAKTVRVVLRPRFAGWRGLFGSILPSHALRGRDLTGVWSDRIDDPRTGRPIGSGPFLVERLERGRQLTLVRNPRYWGRGGPASLDRIVVRFGVDGNTLVDSFRRGELHVALGPPRAFIADLRRQPGLSTVSAPGVTWEHLAIRVDAGGHPALQDKRIRQALAYGIDRIAIARASFGDILPSIPPSDSAIYPNQSRHYRPNWSGYRYRPAEARRRLEQAGCRRGTDGIYVCADRRLSVRIASTLVPGGFRPRVIELAQTQLRQAGVEVVPLFVPQAVLFGQMLPRGEFDLALFAWVQFGPDPSWGSVFGCGREQNDMGYCQRLVTRDLDQADRILDPARQAAVLNRADAQMAKDVPVVPLFQWPVWATITRDLRGFTPAPHLNGLADAERWWLDR